MRWKYGMDATGRSTGSASTVEAIGAHRGNLRDPVGRPLRALSISYVPRNSQELRQRSTRSHGRRYSFQLDTVANDNLLSDEHFWLHPYARGGPHLLTRRYFLTNPSPSSCLPKTPSCSFDFPAPSRPSAFEHRPSLPHRRHRALPLVYIPCIPILPQQ